MFVNCPKCRFLVALDEQGLPLPRCPNCAHRLRDAPEPPSTPPSTQHASRHRDTASNQAATTTTTASAANTESDHTRDSAAVADTSSVDPDPTAAATASEQPICSGPHTDAGADTPAAQLPISVSDPVIHPSEPVKTTQNQAHLVSASPARAESAALLPPAVATRPSASSALAADVANSDVGDARERTHRDPQRELASPPEARITVEALQDSSKDEFEVTQPSFARTPSAAALIDRRRQRLNIAAIAALLALLLLQIVLAQRAQLASDARWRPLVGALCAALGCNLPPWREPQAFSVLEHTIQEHAPGVLRVSARIRNNARWPQPWPVLQLTLSDAQGRNVATRAFTPREYLGGVPAQALLSSDQTAALSMDIVEPGPQAIGFEFDFH